MGFGSALSRAWDVVSGVAEGAADTVNFAGDLMWWSKDEQESFTAEVREKGVADAMGNWVLGGSEHGQSAAENLIGPDKGLGAAIGGIPTEKRDEIQRNVLDPLYKVESAATRGVGSAVTATDMAINDHGSLLEGETWQQAWNITEERSAGQAIALSAVGIDPLDPAARERVINTPLGSVFSGAADALLAWYAPSPAEFVGGGAKAAKAARAHRMTPSGRNAQKVINRFFESNTDWVSRGAGNMSARMFGGSPETAQALRQRMVDSGFDRWEDFIETHRSRIEARARQQYDPEIDKVLRQQRGKSGDILDLERRADEIGRAVTDAGPVPQMQRVQGGLYRYGDDIEIYRSSGRWKVRGYDGDTPARFGNLNEARRWLDDNVSPDQQRLIRDADDIAADLDKQANQYESLLHRQRGLEHARDNRIREELAANIHRQLGGSNVGHQPLAEALAWSDDAAQRELVWRTFTGDPQALGRLKRTNGALFSQIEDLKVRMQTEADVAADDLDAYLAQQDLSNSDGLLASMQRQREDLFRQADQNERLQGLYAAGSDDLLRAPSTRDSVQANRILGRDPVTGRTRKMMEKMPDHVWDLNNSAFVERLDNWLRDSGLSRRDIDHHVGRIVAARDPGDRWRALNGIEDDVFRRVARNEGVSDDVAEVILARAADARRANRKLFSRGGKYGQMRTPDGDDIYIKDPIAREQLADSFMPINLADTRKSLRQYKKWAKGNPEEARRFEDAIHTAEDGTVRMDIDESAFGRRAREMAEEGLSGMYSLWKAGRVARGAYTARAMLLDEAMRTSATFGGARTGLEILKGSGRVAGRFLGGQRGPQKAAVVAGLSAGMAGAGIIPAGLITGAAYLGTKALPSRVTERLAHFGNRMGAYGDTVDAQKANRRRVGEQDAYAELVAEGSNVAKRVVDAEVQPTGRWQMMDPDAEGYTKAWMRNINQQLRRDPLFRMALEGRSHDEMAAWMVSDEGIQYRRTIDPRLNRDIDEWVDTSRGTRDALFGGDDVLAREALDREVTSGDLQDMVGRGAKPSSIHGEVIREMTEPGWAVKSARTLMEPMVELFATLPSDELLRSPFFQMRYEQVIRRRLQAAERAGDMVTPSMERRWRAQAREQAMTDMSEKMYNFADRSRFAHATRFLQPFFSPFENAARAWFGFGQRGSGLIAQNPLFASRLVDSFFQIRDQFTSVQTEDGRDYRVIDINDDMQSIIEHVPWLQHMPEGVKLSPNAATVNVILQSPGAGPWTALLKPLVRRKPELEGSLKLLFPYGIGDSNTLQGDLISEFTPTVVNRMIEQHSKDSARAQSLRAQLMQNHRSMMAQGLEPQVEPGTPEYAELVEQVEREADSLLALDNLMRNWSPVRTQVTTWAEPYMRSYRQMLDEDPDTAMDRFIAEHGSEFLPVVESVYQTNLSLPTDAEALEALRNPEEGVGAWLHRAAKEDPGLSRYVVGNVGAGSDGEFAREVWMRFRNEDTSPGSGTKVIEHKTLDEAFTETDVTLGWRNYMAVMDEVDNQIEAHGYSSLGDPDAAWLKQQVEQTRQRLAQEYPGWWAEYNKAPDRNEWEKRERFLREFSQSPEAKGRAGMRSMRTYFKVRDEVERVLAQSEHSTLQAQSNEPLRREWEKFVSQLVLEDPTFAESFRYLLESKDPFNRDIDMTEVR